MEDRQVAPNIGNSAQGYSLLKIAAPNDSKFLCPISYVFNYLPFEIPWLTPQPISLDRVLTETGREHRSLIDRQATKQNSIRLHAQATGLPLHTGLEDFRQNIYWGANEQSTKELLELFAQDQRCSNAMLSDERSMSDLAREQLRVSVRDTYSRFSMYMFADADENRIQLLAQSVILIFMFDDVWENNYPKTVKNLRESLVSRLQGKSSSCTPDTPLERRINAIRQGLLTGDEEGGNGGAEVLQTLIDFCHHGVPRDDFSSVRDYLDYRWEDIANGFTWACSKFAIRSGVDREEPKLHSILRSLGDHISIANDIASYEKEKRGFETGKAASMINLVHVIMKVDRVEANAAKTVAYAWQLHTENEILEKLKQLMWHGELSIDEWRFLDSCLVATSGNLLTSVVIARYGGENARIT